MYERFEIDVQHSERLLSMVQEITAEAGLQLTQLDALAFGQGPGSFTALRIGIGVVQGLAYSADLPVVGVSSLAVLAQGIAGDRILPAIDARMDQVYWGAYVRNRDGLVESVEQERVVSPEHIPVPEGQGWIGAGSGWDRYGDLLLTYVGSQLQEWRHRCFPKASHVAELGIAAMQAGLAVPAEQAVPVYLRDDVAHQHRQR